MHFLLLGSTGRTGQLVVNELLAQGHTAVSLVRSPDKLKARKGLTIVKGSTLNRDDIEKAVTATSTPLDGCIFTLGSIRTSDSPFAAPVSPPRFMADSAANAVSVLANHNVSRIVIQSTAGIGDSWAGFPTFLKMFMGWTNVKYTLADHNLLDAELPKTAAQYTLVRPMRIVFDTRKETQLEVLPSNGGGKLGVSNAAHLLSVAKFLVKVAVEGLYVRETILVRDK
ncbi:hypothetical protein HMPREF1624_04914 [Sporothrix schenckii ATCC 58251]|uniref:NAD(P)-binding domain-containing protein n=1 Tax=Sporothrix schenckii (strain ATCC 58251 / de Perez 2211183) TaxID=1391915 RepID=U7PTQ3_SPOS1|nr:hypothetical protein HMPREF1624_04914 [Sporothrix schenckii ATCC 58251]